MLQNLKDTARQSLIYGIGNLVVKLTGLLLLPLYAGHLSVSDYGMWGILEITGQILVGIISFRIPAAYLRWVADENTEEGKKTIFFTSFVALFSVLIGFNLLFQPFSSQFAALLFEHADFQNYFTILFLSVSFEILGLLTLQLLRSQQKSFYFIGITLVKFLTILLVTIYCVAYLKMGVLGVLYGTLSGNLLMWLLTIPIQLKNSVFRINIPAAKGMFRYGAPLIFSMISYLLLTLGDRYILKLYHDYEEIGLYTLAFKIGSVVNVFIISSFSLGFLPIAYKMFSQPQFAAFFSKVTTWFMLIMAVSSIGISLFSQELIKYFTSEGPEFWNAYLLVPLITFNFILKGLQFIQSVVFHVSKQTKYDAIVLFIALVISIGFNFLLVPIYGAWGSMWATFIAYFIMNVFTFIYSKKILNIPYEYNRILILLVGSALIMITGWYIRDMGISSRLIIKLLLLGSFFPLLWVFGFFFENEKTTIMKFRRYWNSPAFWTNLISGKKEN